jgi:hypothetical protein
MFKPLTFLKWLRYQVLKESKIKITIKHALLYIFFSNVSYTQAGESIGFGKNNLLVLR